MPIHKRLFYLFLLSLPTQLGRHFWPNWSFVWGLRIDYLAPTIYLSDILLGLTLGSWVISILNKTNKTNRTNWEEKIKKQFSSTFFYFFLLFSTFSFLNFHTAAHPLLWFYKLVKLIELALLGVYVAKTTKTKADFKRIVNLLLIGAVFESLLTIVQFFKQGSVNGVFWWLGERTFNLTTPGIAKIGLKHPLKASQALLLRPYGTFSHPNSLAGYLLVTIILAFTPVHCRLKSASCHPDPERSQRRRISTALRRFFRLCLQNDSKIILLPLLAALFLTFSRSAWLVGLILLFAHQLQKKPTKKLFNYPAIRVFNYLLASLLTGLLIYWFIDLFLISDPQNFQKRWQLASSAWQMFKGAPLFGIGLGHFVPTLVKFPQKDQIFWLQPVHNIFLLVMAETGLIGLCSFLFLIIKSLKNLLKIHNCKLVIPLLAILLTGAADHYWLTLQQNQLLFALVLGLCWTNWSLTKTKSVIL